MSKNYRILKELISSICDELNIEMVSLSGDWLFELRKDGQTHRIIGTKFDLNDSVSADIAKDKVATYELLSRMNLPIVRHELMRMHSRDYEVSDIEGPVVVKPLEGTGGRSVRRFESLALAKAWMSTRSEDSWAISPFVDITVECRFILLDDELLLCYEKHPVIIDGMKMFNLSLGATAHETTPTSDMISLAQRAREILGMHVAAVDIIEDIEGRVQILEVNTSITLNHYAHTSKIFEENARSVYKRIIERLFSL